MYTGHDSKLMQVCSWQECGIFFDFQVFCFGQEGPILSLKWPVSILYYACHL